MNIPKGWPTVKMVSAAYNSYMRSDDLNTAERFTKVLVEALSAAPTPPEVEPAGYVNPRIISILNRRGSTDATIGAVKTTIYSEPLFTSPPSHRAKWDAEGNPLNLEAAARDAVDFYDHGVSIHEQRILVNLRKFLKDES